MYGDKVEMSANCGPVPMSHMALKPTVHREMAMHLREVADHTHDGFVNGVVSVATESIGLLQERIREVEGAIKETFAEMEMMQARNESRNQEIRFIEAQIQRLRKIQE